MKKLFFLSFLAALLLTGCFDYQKNLPMGPWLGVIRIDSAITDMDLPFNMVYEKNIDVSPGENKHRIEIDKYCAWTFYLRKYRQKTQKKEILESAIKVAEALKRKDWAQKLRERIKKCIVSNQ